MNCSSCIAGEVTPLVLDTSALINLHASGYGEHVLRSLPFQVFVPSLVVQDLEHETSRANGEYRFMHDSVSAGLLKRIEFDSHAWHIYGNVVAGSASLGDGEASVIAIASSKGFIPIMDDAKGRRLCGLYVPDKVCGWSLDLFLHPDVEAELTEKGLKEAIYYALHIGRMRIDSERCEGVVGLIGIEQALTCPSLPGFKLKAPSWRSRLT